MEKDAEVGIVILILAIVALGVVFYINVNQALRTDLNW